MDDNLLRATAKRQAGMLSRRQLNLLGFDHNYVRHQVGARRWVTRTPLVVSTTTGSLTFVQRAWLGLLHAGPGSAVGGLSAAKLRGLKNWERTDVTILIPADADVAPAEGISFVRTRRDISAMVAPDRRSPVCGIEPAVLLFAAYTSSSRTACGLLAAAVQQRLTTAQDLKQWLELMRPLRRARLLRAALVDVDGGAQSMAEIDIGRVCRRFLLPLPGRQIKRRDQFGVIRYTDCEWRLPNGRVVVLEIDGAFHMEAEHWAADMTRERGLVIDGSTVLRCSSIELRRSPGAIARDLRAVGVGGRGGEASA